MINYIIITMTICGISGGTQYVYNKINYLKRCGYKVYVFSSLSREILIDELREYKDYVIPNLMYSPDMFTNKEVNSVLHRILEIVKCENGEYIIESNNIDNAKWGELLAKELGCPSLFMNIQEVHNYSQAEKNFLKHLVKEKSLFGITETSVPTMIDTTEGIDYNHLFVPFCSNVVQECIDSISNNIPKADIVISSIGRLEKQCVFPVLEGIKRFAHEHNEKTISIVLIGGTEINKVNKAINTMFNDIDNVSVYITGFLYPIPKTLFRNIDLFISTSGSANVSYWEGRPTILVHPILGKPVGVLGVNASFETDMFKEECDDSLEELIDKILNDSLAITYEKGPYSDNTKMDSEFARQLSFAKGDRSYYDTSNVSKVSSKKYFVYKILGKTMGGKLMQKTLESTRKFTK